MTISAFAQDAAATESVIFENKYLSTIFEGVVVVLGFVFTWVGKLIIVRLRKLGLEEAVIDEISTQTTRTYHNGVKQAKKAASDNRLTKEEAIMFRSQTIDAVIDALKGPALDFAKTKGKDWIVGKVEDIINAKRGK